MGGGGGGGVLLLYFTAFCSVTTVVIEMYSLPKLLRVRLHCHLDPKQQAVYT